MKMVRNKVIMTTDHFGFMNLGRLGFDSDPTTEKPTEKSGTVTTLVGRWMNERALHHFHTNVSF